MTTKPWAGRFEKATDKSVEAFTASIAVDQRLAPYDIAGSMAHASMLGRQGIITQDEAQTIVSGLLSVWQDFASGKAALAPDLEDVHMNMESLLSQRIGPVAGKLHTARSRNDQVALDIRLFTKEAIASTLAALCALQDTLVELAEQHQETILPGYTHLQRAQPVLLGHHYLAYVQMLQRDKERFSDCYRRVDVLPLGAGALAGVPYPIDRAWVAQTLGFSTVSANSLDTVSDRDFLLEYEAAASICMMHLSRLAEEIILWSSAEFGFIELDDAFATGSSIMPQKKNPDVAELVRGKTGQVFGDLLGLLTTMKGLPLSYNRDLQEDKAGFFHTVDTLLASLNVFAGLLSTMRVQEQRMLSAADEGLLLATDIADYLAKKGLPFREAHRSVGQLVQYAIQSGKSLDKLSLEEYRRFSPHFAEDILTLDLARSVEDRSSYGGTARKQVAEQIAAARNARESEALPQPADISPEQLAKALLA